MKPSARTRWTGRTLVRWLTAGLVAVVVTATGTAMAQDEDTAAERYRLLNLFGDVYERVKADYVEEVGDQELIEAAINGMLSSLDPHSSYLNADHFKDMEIQTKGTFGGLGIEVTMEDGLVKVVTPIDDTPASRAGLEPGDLILKLDDKPVMGLTLTEAVEKMRGRIGTDITLTLRRQGEAPFEVTVTRDRIRLKSVRWTVLDNNVGYIRITTFNEQTMPGLTKALQNIKADVGDALQGYVLDLRNNPGGLLDQAVEVSDTFLERGEVVSTRSRNPDDSQRFNAQPGDDAEGKPVVVLINGGSASASEIVAGALQDRGRALVLGTKSFGKGSVQTIMPLTGHGAMRLTTARYYTPSGRSIQAVGIEPDIRVPQAKLTETENSLDDVREEALHNALTQDNGNENGEGESDNAPEAGDAAPAADENNGEDNGEAGNGDATAEDDNEDDRPGNAEVDLKKDYQLRRAVDLLHALVLYDQARGG